jgi:hypothetical protein
VLPVRRPRRGTCAPSVPRYVTAAEVGEGRARRRADQVEGDEEEHEGGGEVVVLARWAWSGGGGDGLRRAGRERRAARLGRKMHVWGRGRIGMVGPRVGMQNRETVAANCVLGIQIFLLHPNNLI